MMVGHRIDRKCGCFLMTGQNLLSVDMKCMKQKAFGDQFFDTFINPSGSNDLPHLLFKDIQIIIQIKNTNMSKFSI